MNISKEHVESELSEQLRCVEKESCFAEVTHNKYPDEDAVYYFTYESMVAFGQFLVNKYS